MQFVNTGSYNDYHAPRLTGIVAASNPQGKGNKVKTLDIAQLTRFLNVVVKGDPDIFLEQLLAQHVPPKFVTYHQKYKVNLTPPEGDDYELPDPRPLNFRNRMGHHQFCRWAQYDKPVENLASFAVFGATFTSELETIASGDWPMEPDDVLNKQPAETAARIQHFVKSSKQDALHATNSMLIYMLNRNETVLSEQQLGCLAQYITNLPDGLSMTVLRKLVLPPAPRNEEWSQRLLFWNSPDGETAGPLADHFQNLTTETMQDVRANSQSKLQQRRRAS